MALASLNSTPMLAALPVETMIDMGVARPNAQGQAMISTATALIRPNTQLGSGPKAPTDKCQYRNRDNTHHKVAGNRVGHSLHWCFGALSPSDHLYDL